MCGRFLLESGIGDICRKYGISIADIGYIEEQEIFPSNSNVPAVVNRELKLLKWGFDSSFSKRPIINARAETIEDKPMFKGAFLNRRCIIPANAFFEWKTESSKKQKYKIAVRDEEIFSMAAIYSRFAKGSTIYDGFVIITVPANTAMSEIHDRMPAIIPVGMEEIWLDNSVKDSQVFKSMLKPSIKELLITAV
jgi:putative SOS response-associated peptidase YedK